MLGFSKRSAGTEVGGGSMKGFWGWSDGGAWIRSGRVQTLRNNQRASQRTTFRDVILSLFSQMSSLLPSATINLDCDNSFSDRRQDPFQPLSSPLEHLHIPPKTPPQLNLPKSTATARLQAIDTTTNSSSSIFSIPIPDCIRNGWKALLSSSVFQSQASTH